MIDSTAQTNIKTPAKSFFRISLKSAKQNTTSSSSSSLPSPSPTQTQVTKQPKTKLSAMSCTIIQLVKPNPKNSETHTTVPGNQYTTPAKKKPHTHTHTHTRERTERKSKTYHHKAQKLASS
jgi:hypothetical protein